MAPTPTNDDFEPCECNDNLFEDNDASLSPNIAFEATFSRGNSFRRNHASECNYGFWLGFSTANLIEDNVINGNRTAGIAVENGVEMRATTNQIKDNRYGVLLWSKRLPVFETYTAQNDTSRDWLIGENHFIENQVAVRIAADQDHGIKALPETGEYGFSAPAPSRHRLRNNQFQGNGQDFDLQGEIDTIIE